MGQITIEGVAIGGGIDENLQPLFAIRRMTGIVAILCADINAGRAGHPSGTQRSEFGGVVA
jgi:hypothetical protein